MTGRRLLLRLVTLLTIAALAVAAGASARTDGAAPPQVKQAKQATLKIGLVTDIGGLNDRSFNHLAFLGLQRAKAKLSVDTRVLTSSSGSDYIPNLATLAQQNYDLIIGVGFLMSDAVNTVAKRFPNVKFAIIDFPQGALPDKPTNVRGLLFREQEAGYLVGYLSGLMEKARKGPDVIGSVGGQKIPPVDRYIAGYQSGAKKAFPGVTTRNNYSDNFDDQAKCKEIALNQIAAGSVVVFQVAGGCGLGALDAAKEKGVWGIGVDADQSFLGPHILTSATKGVDTAVFDTIKSVQDGSFKGGDKVFGLAQHGVALGKISPKVPKSEVDAVLKIRDEIVAGKAGPIPTTVK